jgi:hypothetical protein
MGGVFIFSTGEGFVTFGPQLEARTIIKAPAISRI